MVAGRMVPLSIVGLLTFVLLRFTFGVSNHFKMKNRTYIVASLLICGFLFCIIHPSVSFGQQDSTDPESAPTTQHQAIFADVQHGLTSGDIGLIARHFAPRVSVSLRGDESGTFSSNQTYYVLGDYLKSRRFAQFEFSTVSDGDSSPYATGEAEFTFNGSKEQVQVYVALSHVGENYLISRLTIY
jgi:hypothetical protein